MNGSAVLIIVSILEWLAGYSATRFASSQQEEIFVKAPIWLFIVCGMPKAPGLPPQYISLRSVGLQTAGCCLFMYGVFLARTNYYPIKNHLLYAYVGSAMLGLLIAILLNKFSR